MEKRTERIKFWLTDKELKQIDRKAKKLGMNRSEYIRYIIANCKIYYRFVGYVEIPEVSQRPRIKADTRKGVAVEYLTEPLPA